MQCKIKGQGKGETSWKSKRLAAILKSIRIEMARKGASVDLPYLSPWKAVSWEPLLEEIVRR